MLIMEEGFLLRINPDTVLNIYHLSSFIEYLNNHKIAYTYKNPNIIINISVIEYSDDSFINYLNGFNSGEIEIYTKDKQSFVSLVKPMDPITISIDKYNIYMKNKAIYVMFDDNVITYLKFLIKDTRFRRYIWEYYNKTPLVVERLVILGYMSNRELEDVINEFTVPF